MEYNFTHSTPSDRENIIKYLTESFPGRFSPEKIYDFWVSKSPDACEDIILIKDSVTQGIKGITFFSKMTFYLSGNEENQFWAWDLYVDESLRKENYGLEFMIWGRNEFQDTYCTGSGPEAQKINLAMGEQNLGEIRKYVGIVNPWWLPFCLCSKRRAYPEIICSNGLNFKLISKAEELPDFNGPFNNELMEPSRDLDYLKWRYFNNLHDYYFYLNSNGSDFFVVREIKFKELRALMLVDFRIDFGTCDFENIYNALKSVADSLKISIIVVGSSLKAVDRVLETHHFKSIGRPRPIMGPKLYKNFKNQIKNRNFAFITLADSDGEIYYE